MDEDDCPTCWAEAYVHIHEELGIPINPWLFGDTHT